MGCWLDVAPFTGLKKTVNVMAMVESSRNIKIKVLIGFLVFELI
jgi:hypothetical protein